MERFANEAALQLDNEGEVDDDDYEEGIEKAGSSTERIFEEKLDQLERALDAPLRLLFMQQLRLLRAQALKLYKEKAIHEGEYAAMIAADTFFHEGADSSRRSAAGWDYKQVGLLLLLFIHETP